ncbi:VOC family protein [Rubrobacter tropicus]|uniref:VOC family protein n=1 Tax=Rubrobacter tropicus TaxID=2653851 RepID=A0A6G8Q6A4_9ACTN|nr:VOC family protein [Rubrobacter tropicus]QIN81983.1 VOC family protein [Rubrobacter tropicus]
MGKREGYDPGTFSWVDLSTGDVGGAKDFYGGLFGWEFEDDEIPGGGIYTMCYLRGDAVAAMVEQDQHPGHWNNYVTVTSVDETAEKAGRLGTRVIEKPFDVMESGRMAVLADPDGAVLCAWEPRDHIGAGRVNDAGCMAWNELQSRAPEKASSFYRDLFGWQMEPIDQDGSTVYLTIRNSAGWMNGGIMPLSGRQGDAPSFWLTYFTVPSCDRAVERAEESGGGLLAGPMEPGMGRIAVLNDPQGAVFAVFEGETDE